MADRRTIWFLWLVAGTAAAIEIAGIAASEDCNRDSDTSSQLLVIGAIAAGVLAGGAAVFSLGQRRGLRFVAGVIVGVTVWFGLGFVGFGFWVDRCSQ
jgi:hypothetical protein